MREGKGGSSVLWEVFVVRWDFPDGRDEEWGARSTSHASGFFGCWSGLYNPRPASLLRWQRTVVRTGLVSVGMTIASVFFRGLDEVAYSAPVGCWIVLVSSFTSF
nr:hypothetical protein CFP56_07677 [Quercus suber]